MAKTKVVPSIITIAYDDAYSNFCCGLQEIGEFFPIEDELTQKKTFRSNMATFATTIASQKAAIAFLKANKFKAVCTFTNPYSKKRVTMWVRKPDGQRW